MDNYESKVLEASALLFEALPGYVISQSRDSDEITHLLLDLIDAIDSVEFNRSGNPILDVLDQPLGHRKRAVLILENNFGLTKREGRVLRYLANDRNTTYIARKLDISQATAKSHKYSIFKKLGIHSSEELKKLLRQNS